MANVIQPPAVAPIVDERSMVTTAWLQFFAALVGLPQAIEVLDLSGGSPFSFTASAPGHVLVQGGTVTGINLTRGRVIVALTELEGWIPVGRGDIVDITFAVVPNAWFVPF